MTQDCLNTYIRDIKCKYYKEVEKLSDSLAYGKRDLKCVFTRVKLLKMYLRLMECYDAFDEEVTAAFAITIIRNNDDYTEADLVLDGISVGTYSGEGDAEEIAAYLSNYINDNSAIWESLYEDDTLYVWSYESTQSYTDSVVLNYNFAETTISYSSLENELDTILDLLNCITGDSLEGIIRHSQKILTTHTSTADCGCGC